MAAAAGGQSTTRLSMLALIREGILEPGVGLLTFDYMGKRCQADLLADGLIQWNGSRYSSPYAWASQCKNRVNPDHKSGIGWGHIRYKGIKLSQYKTMYIKKYQLGSSEDSFSQGEESLETKPLTKKRNPSVAQSESVRSQAAGYKSEGVKEQSHPSTPSVSPVAAAKQEPTHNQVTMKPRQSQSSPAPATGPTAPIQVLETTNFETLCIQQPFTVNVMSNSLMIMDFHSHFSTDEVMGYLGGKFDDLSRTIEVCEAFPCKYDLSNGEKVESEIRSTMTKKGLTVVGWYHSHPTSEPKPTESDILSQKAYQDALRRRSGDEPCIAVITSPNLGGVLQSEATELGFFSVIIVQQDGVKVSPMKVQYSVVWEKYLTQEVVNELNSLASFYKNRSSCPQFMSVWKGGIFFKDKFKKSLAQVQPRFPEETSDETFMNYIEQLIAPTN